MSPVRGSRTGQRRASSGALRLVRAESFPADPASLERIRGLMRVQADASRLSQSELNDMVLAVGEAASNAILHSGGSTVHVAWEEAEDAVWVQIQDDGTFAPRMDTGAGGGRGIPLMVALMEEVSISEGTPSRPGTVVRLAKRRRR